MSFNRLLSDECLIYNRSVTSGKVTTESFSAQSSSVKCRVLKRIANTVNPEKTQYGTQIRTRIVLRKTETIARRDRILHDGTMYEVIELSKPFDRRSQHHIVAFCETVA